MVVLSAKATLHELQTVYSLRDLYDFLEIIAVENHNNRLMARHREAEMRKNAPGR